MASPAAAHDYRVYVEDTPNYGAVYDDHRSIMACDHEADGFTVRVYAYHNYPDAGYLNIGSVADPDGNGGHCGHETYGPQIDAIEACEERGTTKVCTWGPLPR